MERSPIAVQALDLIPGRSSQNTQFAKNPPLLVTAIVATYNRASLVGNAVESILQQTYENIEVILVDDGSTDETQAVLKRFGDRVRVIYQENAGPGAARNRGTRAAKGDIVSFLDSDDVWLPTRIERVVEFLQRVDETVPCCVCDVEMRFTNRAKTTSFRNSGLHATVKEGIWSNAPEVLIDRFVLFNQMAAIRRSALERVGGFNENLRFLEDYDLALRLSLLGPFGFLQESLGIWNQGSAGSLSAEADAQIRRLREFEVQVKEDFLKRLQGEVDREALRAQMRRAAARTRRLLWLAQLRGRYPRIAFVARILEMAQRCSDALVRRSPWFIPMKTEPLPVEAHCSRRAMSIAG
jgi:glycosyltransferase involved in cell wall biosynthesis